MPCDTVRRRRRWRQTTKGRTAVEENVTAEQRTADVRTAMENLERQILRKKVKPVVGPQGAITFAGWTEEDRDGITDACAYRRLMISGSSISKAEIARAEQLAGRTVDRKVMTAGTHSHDGGRTWNGRD